MTDGIFPTLLFPGQGTEAPGMSEGWANNSTWAATLEEAEAHGGLPLRRWMAEGPAETLAAQRHAPYAVIAHSVGLFRAHRAAGMPLPRAATGHSLGFLSAVVATGVVSLGEMFRLVDGVESLGAARFPNHGMAFFIGLQEGPLREALVRYPDLELSNLNGKANFTVSGPRPPLEGLVAELQPQVMKAGLLPVRHPLHASAMAPLLPALGRRLGDICPRTPEFPLLRFTDGRALVAAEEIWDEAMASIALPVRWPLVVAALGEGDRFECGWGTQLANLTRWLDRERGVSSLQAPSGLVRWRKTGALA